MFTFNSSNLVREKSMRVLRTSLWLKKPAKSIGKYPLESGVNGVAPKWSSCLTTSWSPYRQAQCKGVKKVYLFYTLGSAPFSRRKSMNFLRSYAFPLCLNMQAKATGVTPCFVGLSSQMRGFDFASGKISISSSIKLISWIDAARWKGFNPFKSTSSCNAYMTASLSDFNVFLLVNDFLKLSLFVRSNSFSTNDF